jgi:hypothetical protein
MQASATAPVIRLPVNKESAAAGRIEDSSNLECSREVARKAAEDLVQKELLT